MCAMFRTRRLWREPNRNPKINDEPNEDERRNEIAQTLLRESKPQCEMSTNLQLQVTGRIVHLTHKLNVGQYSQHDFCCRPDRRRTFAVPAKDAAIAPADAAMQMMLTIPTHGAN